MSTVKKILFTLCAIAGVAVGGWLLWEFVFPFLGFVFGKMFSLFPSIDYFMN